MNFSVIVDAVLFLQFWTATMGISSIALTRIQDGGPFDYAVTIADKTDFTSLVQCASFCDRRAWCVAVAICQESNAPVESCSLLSVEVTENYASGDNVSSCDVHYSKHRLESLVSCGNTQAGLPQEALTGCQGATSPSTPVTAECVTSLGGGCHCPKGATNTNCTTFITDCRSVIWDKDTYTIQPVSYTAPFQVYCDRNKLIIQRRKDCTSDFFDRTWLEYKEGFGDVGSTCFWLGNEKIRTIANQDTYYLRVKRTQYDSTAKYKTFKLGTEEENYKLQYSEFSKGVILDFSEDGFGDCPADQKLQGMAFYTPDNDNAAGCATNRMSGWWYNSGCAFGDLNQHGSAKWPKNSELQEFSDVSMSVSTSWL